MIIMVSSWMVVVWREVWLVIVVVAVATADFIADLSKFPPILPFLFPPLAVKKRKRKNMVFSDGDSNSGCLIQSQE